MTTLSVSFTDGRRADVVILGDHPSEAIEVLR